MILCIFWNFRGHTTVCDREVLKQMVYVQLKVRVTLEPGTAVRVRHVADVAQPANERWMDLPVSCPQEAGVWKLPAMAVIQALSQECAEITMLGPPECFVHIVPRDKRNIGHTLRAAMAFAFLLIGSALAITWFHADVNMLDAQQSLYRLICGHDAPNQWFITIPYAIGVFFGVALFYALLGRKGTVSPLEIKLEEYQQTAEKAMGKTP